MEEIRPARDPGAGNPSIPQGYDYGYDEAHNEAHDVPAGPPRETPAPPAVNAPPQVNLGEGGDYGYDEAHDFGAR